MLAVGAYVALAVLRALPWLMWLLVGCWLRASWRSGRPPADECTEDSPETPVDIPEDPPAGSPAKAAVAHLRQVLGNRDRVHLSEVLADLQNSGQGAGWTVADLRARLEALGVPTEPKVKVGRVPTRGVYRAALDAHFPTEETVPSPTQVDAA